MVKIILLLSPLIPHLGPQALVRQLGHPTWHVRQGAQERLEVLSRTDTWDRYQRLVEATQGSNDPEVVQRAQAVLARSWDVRPTGGGDLPWIDMLPETYPDRQSVTYRFLHESGWPTGYGSYSKGWDEYRAATALLVRDLLGRGRTRNEVRVLLDSMVARESEWKARQTTPVAETPVVEELPMPKVVVSTPESV